MNGDEYKLMEEYFATQKLPAEVACPPGKTVTLVNGDIAKCVKLSHGYAHVQINDDKRVYIQNYKDFLKGKLPVDYKTKLHRDKIVGKKYQLKDGYVATCIDYDTSTAYTKIQIEGQPGTYFLKYASLKKGNLPQELKSKQAQDAKIGKTGMAKNGLPYEIVGCNNHSTDIKYIDGLIETIPHVYLKPEKIRQRKDLKKGGTFHGFIILSGSIPKDIDKGLVYYYVYDPVLKTNKIYTPIEMIELEKKRGIG